MHYLEKRFSAVDKRKDSGGRREGEEKYLREGKKKKKKWVVYAWLVPFYAL